MLVPKHRALQHRRPDDRRVRPGHTHICLQREAGRVRIVRGAVHRGPARGEDGVRIALERARVPCQLVELAHHLRVLRQAAHAVVGR